MGKKRKYVGRALTFDEQVDMLVKQGLQVQDRERAIHILQNVSYARLKNYLVPLMADRATHRFKCGATFEQAYTYYGFDRRLRELIFHEMEKIEISFRTRFAYASSEDNDGYWFEDPSYFKSEKAHNSILRKIALEIDRSDNDAITGFRKKYNNTFPPCWLMMEATSMGILSNIYKEMRPGHVKRRIAEYYCVSDTVLESWLHHLVYVRNTCAHHGRLWNKTLSVRGLVPDSPKRWFPPLPSDGNQKVYFTLCMVKYLQDTVKPTNTFADRLLSLIDHFPNVDTRYMGFPEGWREDPLWNRSGGKIPSAETTAVSDAPAPPDTEPANTSL